MARESADIVIVGTWAAFQKDAKYAPSEGSNAGKEYTYSSVYFKGKNAGPFDRPHRIKVDDPALNEKLEEMDKKYNGKQVEFVCELSWYLNRPIFTLKSIR